MVRSFLSLIRTEQVGKEESMLSGRDVGPRGWKWIGRNEARLHRQEMGSMHFLL